MKVNNFYKNNISDCFNFVENMKEEVHCVVTSPPYFMKREYGNSKLEFGREKTVEEYIEKLCTLFDKIPLHNRGSLWVNIGDKRDKNGSLQLIPEHFLIAMKKRGWLIADNVIWAKVIDQDDGSTNGCCMIEPSKHRLNSNGYEFLYRFVKTKTIKEGWTDTSSIRLPRKNVPDVFYLPEDLIKIKTSIEGRNLHNVWRLNMGQTKKKHYAVFPISLCIRPIAMTCPILVNPDNTFPERIIEMEEYNEDRGSKRIFGKYSSLKEEDNFKTGRQDTGKSYTAKKPKTKGWSNIQENAVPGIVFDPFSGTGTVGESALRLGRSFIGVDLYKENIDIAKKRCEETLEEIKMTGINIYDIILNPYGKIVKKIDKKYSYLF